VDSVKQCMVNYRVSNSFSVDPCCLTHDVPSIIEARYNMGVMGGGLFLGSFSVFLIVQIGRSNSAARELADLVWLLGGNQIAV